MWKWNGAQYVKVSSELSPVEYRIHAIYEGDDAFTAGDYDHAIDWYGRVITDDTLKDWHAEIGYRTQNDRATLTAYARFRLLLIGVLRGEANAKDQLDQLTAQFPGRCTRSRHTTAGANVLGQISGYAGHQGGLRCGRCVCQRSVSNLG